MNTFAATMPAPRPPDAVAPRSGADAAEASPEAAAGAFGAVLGALKEGRPAKDAARRDAKTADDAAAEAAKPLPDAVGPVEAGTVPPATALDPAALLALIARAVPGASAAPTGAAATAAGPTASEQAPSGRGAAAAAGVAELAAGIVRAAGETGRAQDGVRGLPVGGVLGQGLPPQVVTAQGGPGSPGVVEARPQVTVLQQETHFAPVKPRLVSGQAAAIPAAANPAVAGLAGAPASIAAAPALAAAVTEAPRDGTSPRDVAPVAGP
ncbi:MAG: hypothetical protein Q7T93_05135, partial [Methylobacterium sp.]|nr:hypothetical protein [Methylobacterium sp.]